MQGQLGREASGAAGWQGATATAQLHACSAALLLLLSTPLLSTVSLTALPLLPTAGAAPHAQFACTRGCPFDCASAKAVYSKGHELGDHTVDHKDLRKLSYAQIQQQILGARSTIAACGIPATSIVGFRTPYLSDSPTVRQVLSDAGFRYDSTIGQNGGAARPWPARISGGMPYDCDVAGNQCSKSESYPSLYEVPLYGYPGGNTMVSAGGWEAEGCGWEAGWQAGSAG